MPQSASDRNAAQPQPGALFGDAPFGCPTVDFASIGAQSQQLLESFMNRNDASLETTQRITRAFTDLAERWMNDPEALVRMQLELYQSYLQLWASMAERMMGKQVDPVIEPQKGDRRFSSDEWRDNFVFDYIKQSYLLTSRWMTDNIAQTKDMDDRTKAKLDFYTRQFMDAIAPSNFPMTNPDVLTRTVETKGENLVNGLKNLLADLERGNGKLKISMTDYNAFEVGRNIATTEGQVVYENRMFQLIQYKPQTDKVYERPILFVPPWINKFYILDLHPENSFMKYAVEQAQLNTFIISWKNPDATYRDVSFEDYMKAVFEAMDHVLVITGSKDLNAVGYCIGGTLLTAALAVMKKKNDKRVNAATMFTTLIDFTDAGELGVFIDEEQVDTIEKRMEKQGYLDGSEMAQTFSLLRANDLIWSFVINNYLMGKDPFPFDILYWNDDPTRLPYKMHSYYLRNMYLENNLIKKDKLSMCGEKIDIAQIDTPIYMVTAINDHITPWKSCYAALHKMKSNIRFVLSKAGHVAGVVNPPGNARRAYWVAEDKADSPDNWLASATQRQDSWWPDWKDWMAKASGKLVPAPKSLGDARHKPIEPAPGRYVKEKV